MRDDDRNAASYTPRSLGILIIIFPLKELKNRYQVWMKHFQMYYVNSRAFGCSPLCFLFGEKNVMPLRSTFTADISGAIEKKVNKMPTEQYKIFM